MFKVITLRNYLDDIFNNTKVQMYNRLQEWKDIEEDARERKPLYIKSDAYEIVKSTQMKIKILVLTISLFALSCASKDDADNQKGKVLYRVDENMAFRANMNDMERFVSTFVDSIDKAKDESELPAVLKILN